MEKLFLKFRDGRPQPNLLIEAVKVNGMYHVEIWDVTTIYHSHQMMESERTALISEHEQEVKELKLLLTNNKEKDLDVRKQISDLRDLIAVLNKYKNKRLVYTKGEFESEFEVLSSKIIEL
jgi:hypothetical protein